AAAAAVAGLAAVALPQGGSGDLTAVPLAPEGPPDWILRANPAVGGVLLLPHPHFPDDPIRVWYSRGGKDGELRFCSARRTTAAAGLLGSCVPAGPLGRAEAGRIGGRTGRFPGSSDVVVFGMARESVHSVTATVGDGRSVRGTVLRDRGLPAPIWMVRIPGGLAPEESAVRYDFADARGGRLQRLESPFDRGCVYDGAPNGTGVPLAGGVSAHLHEDNCLILWKGGAPVGASNNPARRTLGEDLRAPRRIPDAPVSVWAGPGQAVAGAWYGYTDEETVRVELRVRGARRVSADTVAAFPGQGVRLFGGRLPDGADPHRDGAVYVGFGAGGEELWRYEVVSYEISEGRSPEDGEGG
ncbi:hypothetical protein ACFOWE_33650, partial [Planomonospora corallina]